MKLRSKLLIGMVLLLACEMFCFWPGSAKAADYNWRFGHEEIEGGFMDTYAQEFKKKLAEKSAGRIRVDIYPAQSLGTSQNMVELVQDGVLEFNFASDGHAGSLIPQVQVFLLDYIFPKDLKIVTEVINYGQSMELLAESFRARKLEPLSHQTEGWQVWTANQALRNPEDFNGFRMRTMTSRLLIEAYGAYGANPTATDFAEVYSGLQLGVIDGQLNPIPVIEEMGFYEVQDYLIKAYSNPFLCTLITNVDFYQTLPDDIRTILDQTVDEMVTVGYEIQERLNRERIGIMLKEKPSLKLIELTEQEIAAFKELSMPVRDIFVQIGGENAREILDLLLQDIERAMQN